MFYARSAGKNALSNGASLVAGVWPFTSPYTLANSLLSRMIWGFNVLGPSNVDEINVMYANVALLEVYQFCVWGPLVVYILFSCFDAVLLQVLRLSLSLLYFQIGANT
jgi:hypothetical protein